MKQHIKKISYHGLIVWLICALFFMYEFLLRTILGTFQQPLMNQLHLTPLTFALLSSTSYQLIYCLMQIPVGFISQRFGLKKTLFAAVIICVIAELGFSISSSFTMAIVFRLIMGFGSSFGFVCLLIAVYDWIPRKNIALFIGLSQFIGTLGPMLAAGPMNVLAQQMLIGWRGIFACLASFGVLLAGLILLVVDLNKKPKIIVNSFPQLSFFSTFFQFIRQKQVWFIALFSAFIYLSLEYLSENECKTFLTQKGFAANYSVYMISLAWLGYAIGCALLGFISDFFQRRKIIMLISAIVAMIALTCIIYLPLNPTITAFCFIFLGIGASGQSIGFAIMAENCQGKNLAIGLGFNNAMIGLSSAIIAPIIGFTLSQVSQYSALKVINFQEAFFILIILLLIALILAAFFIKETFCKTISYPRRLEKLLISNYSLSREKLQPISPNSSEGEGVK